MRLAGWRLTPDPAADPNAEAARYRLGGRPAMAEFVLEEAIKREPGRKDLRNHLASLQARRQAQLPTPMTGVTVSSAFVVLHMLFAWALLIVLVVAILCLPLYFLEPLAPALDRMVGALGITGISIAVMLMLAWVMVAAVLWVKSFCVLWFKYLGQLPEAHALAADASLSFVMNTWQFGRAYTLSRQLFFAERYGGSSNSVGIGNA